MENEILNKRRNIRNRKGQGVLEVAIVVILVVLLVGGITKIFLWATTQIINRQISYNKGRIAAGKAEDGYTLKWPLPYKPPALTENDVLLYRE